MLLLPSANVVVIEEKVPQSAIDLERLGKGLSAGVAQVKFRS